MEKKKSNDYLIGFILALLFLTKQSIGVLLLFPSLYYMKDLKKLLRRFIGFLGPNIVFLIYLIFTKSFYNFLDLCFFGLFDFAGDNNKLLTSSFFIAIFIFILNIIFIKKNRDNLIGYYSLAFFIGMVVPIFDYWHLYYGICAVMLFLLTVIKKKCVNEKLLLYGVVLLFGLLKFDDIKTVFTFDNGVSHFENKNLGLSRDTISQLSEVNEFIQKHRDNLVILSKDAYLLKISNDLPITNTDLINTGNFGYNGTNKMIDILKKKEDTFYLIAKHIDGQTDKKIIDYVIKNAEKIDEIAVYDVYYM